MEILSGEAVKILDIHYKTLYDWVKEGKVKYRKSSNGFMFFDKKEIIDLKTRRMEQKNKRIGEKQ